MSDPQKYGNSDTAQRPRLFRLHLILIVAVAAVLVGCATPQANVSEKKLHFWPAWPEQPRFAFEATLGTEASIVSESKDEQFQRQLTGASRSIKPIIDKPAGLAVRHGRVYVAEPAVRAITVMDAARGKLFRFGVRPPNTMKRPQSIALDARGNVYVLDVGLRQIMVFDDFGLFLSQFPVAAGFTSPIAVAVSPDGQTIFVVDRGDLANEDHKVVAFTPDGKEKYRLGARGSDLGKFNIPLDATVSIDGTLLVADAGNARIQAFDSDGKFKFTFGGFGAEPGRFSRPRSISTDSEGNIYVADGSFNNVQIFNPKGELLMPLGKLSQEPGPGNFSLIGAIAIDEEDRLFVTDNFFKKIDVFKRLSDEEGKKILATTDAGSK